MIFLPILCCTFLASTQGHIIHNTSHTKPLTEHRFDMLSVDTYNNTYPLSTPITVSNGTKHRIAPGSDLDTHTKPLPERRLDMLSVDTYNNTYPLSTPITVSNGTKYRIALVSDLDTSSKKEKGWISYLQKGYLTYNPTGMTVSIDWDAKPEKVSSEYSIGDRGMELSELIVFNGTLLAVDDRTGIICELHDSHEKMHPWVILSDGDGHSAKGFKAEWATVKDGTLYVGSHGKVFTTPDGKVELNSDPQWIKTVSTTGEIRHFNWKNSYNCMLRAQRIDTPEGYSLHESGVWSSIKNKWYFLPRKASKETYNSITDEKMGTNVLLTADPDFSNITVTHIGEIIPTRGYSSMKFIPGTNDTVIVALKTEEISDETSTFITVFTTSGQILLPDSKIATYKYEGIEFV